MATTVIAETKSAKPSAEEMLQLWLDFKADMNNQDLRNRLVENYLPLVKYNGLVFAAPCSTNCARWTGFHGSSAARPAS
jgi:hypothetical protein